MNAVQTVRLAAIASLAWLSLGSCARDRKATIWASGHVETNEVRLAFPMGGRLEWYPHEEGVALLLGDPVARLDTTDLHLALEAVLGERDVAAAESRLRETGARSEDIAAAKADLTLAEAEWTAAERDRERAQSLFDSGTGTQKSREDAGTRSEIASARRDGARERWRRLVRGSRVEEVEAARARLRAAEARTAELRRALDEASIESPLAGVLTERLAEPGEILAPAAPIALVTKLDPALIVVWVSEPDLDHVRLGAAVDVRTDGGEVARGVVSSISSKAEFTPKNVQTREERARLVFQVRISTPNPNGVWKPGLPVEAHFLRRSD